MTKETPNPKEDLVIDGREKRDPLDGFNADQSGPKEQIQNGDPRSGSNRDQRSGKAEAGGPGGSIQEGPTGDPRDHQIPPHQNDTTEVSGEPKSEGATDRAGTSPLYKGEPLKDLIDGKGTLERQLEEGSHGIHNTRKKIDEVVNDDLDTKGGETGDLTSEDLNGGNSTGKVTKVVKGADAK